MKFITGLKKFAYADEGQDLLEYALLVALIALVSAGVIGIAGTNVKAIFASIGSMAGGEPALARMPEPNLRRNRTVATSQAS